MFYFSKFYTLLREHFDPAIRRGPKVSGRVLMRFTAERPTFVQNRARRRLI